MRTSPTPRLWPMRPGACCALALVLLVPLQVSARARAPLRLSSRGAVACPAERQVRRALEQQLGKGSVVLLAPRAGEVSLTVESHAPGKVSVALSDGKAEEAHRAFDVRPGECAAAAQTIALVVVTWLQQVPWRAYGLFPEAPAAELPAAEEQPAAGAPFPPAAASAPEKEPASPPAPEALPPQPPQIEEIAFRPPPAVVAPEAGRAALHLKLGMMGGPAWIPDGGHWMAAGGLRVELGLGEVWGVGLQGTTSSAASTSAGSGAVSATTSSVLVFARRSLHASGAGVFSLLAGLSLDPVSASSAGYPRTAAATLWGGGLGVLAQWERPIAGRVDLLAGLGANLRWPEESLSIDPRGTVLTVPPLRLVAAAGVVWKLF